MARTGFTGFETGLPAAESMADGINWAGTVIGTTITCDSSIARTGTYSLKVVPTSGATCYCDLGVGIAGWARVYMRVTSRPATTARGVWGFAANLHVMLNPDGTLELKNGAASIGTSKTALTDTSRWYMVEVRVSGGTSVPVLRIDGSEEVIGSPSSWLMSSMFGNNDTVADTYTVYFDDFCIDDAGFPGPGYSVLLRPTSLNAAGGWVEGDGAGTAGMAAAVATRPPPGLASASETSATNIESPTNSATDNCDMNMTSYTAAGIPAQDEIVAVRAFVRHGEDIATSTKAGAIQLISNPAGSEESGWNFGADGGAHGSDATSASLWVNKVGTIIQSLALLRTIARGTEPVLRVGKRTATTRVVCVDFMGIYVDVTPAPAAAMPQVPVRFLYLRKNK